VIAYGPEARAFLQSGLADRLAKDWEVVVATPEPDSIAFTGRREPLVRMPDAGESPGMRRFRGLSRGFRRRAPALTAMSLQAERMAGRLWGGGGWSRFLRDHAIDAVVAASATGARTLPLLQAAANQGLPSAVLLNSWKDLHGRGELPVPVTALGVVTRRDRSLLRGAAGVAATVAVCGSLHQSAVRWAPAMTRQDFCLALGLDPARPIVLYATAANDPEEVGRLHWLSGQLAAMQAQPQLLIRPNPMDDASGAYDAMAERLGAGLLYPRWEWRREREWNCPLPEDLPWWRAALEHSAMAVGLASTVAFDCAAWGKPSISLAWGRGVSLWSAAYEAVRNVQGALAASAPQQAAALIRRVLTEPPRLEPFAGDPAQAAFELIRNAFPPAVSDPRKHWARPKAVTQ
jgi:hypothetical protein